MSQSGQLTPQLKSSIGAGHNGPAHWSDSIKVFTYNKCTMTLVLYIGGFCTDIPRHQYISLGIIFIGDMFW